VPESSSPGPERSGGTPSSSRWPRKPERDPASWSTTPGFGEGPGHVLEHGRLRAALHRLRGGTPIRTSGALTISGLAAEAGVSRATANRATEILSDLAQLRQHQADSSPGHRDDTSLRAELATTKRAHTETVRELRASVDTLAQHVQVLTLENHALRRSLAAHDATIVPLPGAGL